MEWHERFSNLNPPTYEDMEQYIGGEGQRLWQELFACMENNYHAKN